MRGCCCLYHPSNDNSGGVRYPFLAMPANGCTPSIQPSDSPPLSCVFILLQLNKCVVYGSVFHRGCVVFGSVFHRGCVVCGSVFHRGCVVFGPVFHRGHCDDG